MMLWFDCKNIKKIKEIENNYLKERYDLFLGTIFLKNIAYLKRLSGFNHYSLIKTLNERKFKFGLDDYVLCDVVIRDYNETNPYPINGNATIGFLKEAENVKNNNTQKIYLGKYLLNKDKEKNKIKKFVEYYNRETEVREVFYSCFMYDMSLKDGNKENKLKEFIQEKRSEGIS